MRPNDDRADVRAWLERSWNDPPQFLQAALDEHARDNRLVCASVVGERVALFDDAVSRYRRSSFIAFETIGGPAVSYNELSHKVCQRASYFQRGGVGPGSSICFVVADPIVVATGVLAAWKIGAVVSLVHPRGESYVRRRLQVLAPDFVAVAHPDGRWFRDLPREQLLCATLSDTTPLPPGSYVFAPEEPVAQLFSPFASDPLLPVSLTAHALLCGAIREGLVLYALTPGQVIAAPSLDPQRHEPMLLLCALLAGATRRVVGDNNDIETGTEPYKADIVGLTGAEYRAAAVGKLDLRAATRCFCALAEPLDVLETQEVASALLERKLPGPLTLGCAAAGGTFAWAPKPEQAGLLELLPAPGLAFSLTDPVTAELEAAGPAVLTLLDVDPEAGGSFVFGRHRGQFYFGGAMWPSNGGETFLRQDIEAVAGQIDGVRDAVTVLRPGALPNDGRLTLLVFVDPWAASSTSVARVVQSVARAMNTELGPQIGRVGVEVFPLVAPGEGGVLDAIQCETQFSNGSLLARRNDSLFGDVAKLRRTLELLGGTEAVA